MPKLLKFRYDGERTVDPVLGLLERGTEGDGELDVVAVKIAGGLLTAVDDEGRAAAAAILEANEREAEALKAPAADASAAPRGRRRTTAPDTSV